jgi:hypothetical protein
LLIERCPKLFSNLSKAEYPGNGCGSNAVHTLMSAFAACKLRLSQFFCFREEDLAICVHAQTTAVLLDGFATACAERTRSKELMKVQEFGP